MEKYDKLKTVGRGAFGIVHLCRSISDSQLVIVKEIPMDDLTTEDRIASKNEINVLKMLHHPNIIGYYDSFTAEKSLMIVMEYAPGGTVYDYLQQRLSQNMLLEEEEILKKFAQILLAIHHIHSQNILHRDLKTHNIFLSKNRKILKIGDFGISKVMTKTNASTLVGSPYYLSPELCQNHPYNQKSDVWALGCILYELATLKRPFDADNISAIVCKIMKGQYQPISEHYSQELKQLITSLLHLDPARRPNVNKIMAQTVMINSLLDLSTDIGRVPYKFVPKPTGGFSAALPPKTKRVGQLDTITASRSPTISSRSSSNSGTTRFDSVAWDGGTATDLSSLLTAPNTSAVYFWGSGVKVPALLALPQGEQTISTVSVGRTLKLGVTGNGRVFSWENQVSAETLISVDSYLDGGKPTESVLVPKLLEGLSGVTITQVSCGDLFAAVLTDRGMLLTFGSGSHGCLGHGGNTDATKPKIIEALLGYSVVQLSCGAAHVMIVTDAGDVFSWGRGDSGRLGIGSSETKSVPTKVPVPSGYKADLVKCGVDCSFVLSKEKIVLACGNNKSNKLGLWTYVKDGEAPNLVPMTSPPLCNEAISMVQTGTSHTAFLTDDGVLYTVGSNSFFQLGYQREDNAVTPQKVLALEDKVITYVGCGDTFTLAVTEDGEVYTWGKGRRGRLGRGSEESSPVPGLVRFQNKESMKIHSLAVSHGNTLLIASHQKQL
ncbi:serine/threonine-protein kinase Nek8-like [Rhopilema esculentum]|uniref:serine/threonine-protein kinase Nek8-like n=1 Tax=Rhopilema esculentum TaxID=499914 RepID=UPI0031D5DD71